VRPRVVHSPVLPASSDAELAQRVAAGDHAAFNLLMRRHNQALYRTARSILKDSAEAEDAVQDAWLRAYAAIGRYRAEAKLSTWLVRIAANEAIARFRTRRRTAEVVTLDGEAQNEAPAEEAGMNEAEVEQPEQSAVRAETRRLLERKIDQLPDAFRAVFMLRGVEEWSVEETAAALEIPEATVRTRYFRARGLLRESLSREMDVALEHAFRFDGARCDRIVAGVLARLDAKSP
jgi:RNA polymerase sigma-70 factor (ECF subfamily)